MKGDPKVIELLNEGLKAELTAINQYWLHYRILDNWGVKKLAAMERHESIDEMKHADKFSERILFLDGLPNFQSLGSLRIGESVEEILKADLEAEYEAVDCTQRGDLLRKGPRLRQPATCSPTLLKDEEGMSTSRNPVRADNRWACRITSSCRARRPNPSSSPPRTRRPASLLHANGFRFCRNDDMWSLQGGLHMTAVTEPGQRIVTLDVIRGIAVMGIFSVNVVAFAFIFPAYMNPAAAGLESGIDLATWFANFVLVDGKMRGLFSILFGASMLLVIERAVAAGRSGASVHYRRMIVLALFGLAHFYFIWFGDILFLYAMMGMIAYLFIRKRPKSLLVWAAALFLLNAAFMAASSAYFRTAEQQASAANATPAQIGEWNKAKLWGLQSEEKTARDIAIQRGSIVERSRHMLSERATEPLGSLVFLGPETLARMLLGIAAYKSVS